MARPLRPEHLQAAFQAMAWEGWTYEAAMADPARKAVISWRARQICNAQAKAGRRVVAKDRPQAPLRMHLAPRGCSFIGAAIQDLKRAAAGDRDD